MRLLAGGLILFSASWANAQQQIGEIIFVRGTNTAQPKTGDPRILGEGSPLFEQDVLRTGPQSYAVLKLIDGTRITLRSRTTFTVEEFVYDETGTTMPANGAERARLRLYRGGIRINTGRISKRNPGGLRLVTPQESVTVRGTDFEARLCEEDCREEANRVGTATGDTVASLVARLAFLSGGATAAGTDGQTRVLSLGAGLFAGDTIQTGAGALAVVVFRDESRVTLRPNSGFKIEAHRYLKDKPESGSSLLRFVRGGIRVVSGLIGRARPDEYKVETPVAVLSVRGTGFDLRCQGTCAASPNAAAPPTPWQELLHELLEGVLATAHAQTGNGLDTWVWEGSVQYGLAQEIFVIEQGQAVFYDGVNPPTVYPSVPSFFQNLNWPDTDPSLQGQDLFGAAEQDEPEIGLYVRVIEGDVEVTNQQGQSELAGAGETIFAGSQSQALARIETPRLILAPNPTQFDDPQIQRILQLLDPNAQTPESAFECVVQ